MAVVLILIALPVIICFGTVASVMFSSTSEMLIGSLVIALGLGALYGLLRFMRTIDGQEVD